MASLNVEVDVIYGRVAGGKVYKHLYVTAGVRRLALKYDIRIADLAEFTRKPGLWDPRIHPRIWARQGRREPPTIGRGGSRTRREPGSRSKGRDDADSVATEAPSG